MSADEHERFDARDDAWLFDGGPAPDAASARLERLLALQRARPAAPRGVRRFAGTALAATLALALGGAWLAFGRERAGRSYAVRLPDGVERLRAGERLVAPDGGARLDVADLGDVRLEPGARLLARAAEPGRHRFFLEQGSLTASITAEPGAFGVDTPAGSSVDLGCLYTLDVDAAGDTTLAVALGRVSFTHEGSGRDAYVPAGASMSASVAEGPLSPLWETTSSDWRATVAELDRAVEPSAAALARLDASEDTLALWHLLQAPSAATRAAAFERLRELVDPPLEVARAAIVDGDPRAQAGADARRAWLSRMDWYSFAF